MLFQQRFHEGLRDGSITESFRTWSSPRVKVGGYYRFGTRGQIEVDEVERVRVGDITKRQACHAGFDDEAELRAFLSRSAKKRLDSRSNVYRVRLHYAGAAPAPPATDPLAADSEVELRKRLAGMDRRARHGAWTDITLKLIAKHPGTPARVLAERLGRETPPFKADVRKLKKLGLTLALEVGYELSPRGRALLASRSS
jgi:hypothetical protein